MEKKSTDKKQMWGDIEIDDKFKDDLLAFLEKSGYFRPRTTPQEKKR